MFQDGVVWLLTMLVFADNLEIMAESMEDFFFSQESKDIAEFVNRPQKSLRKMA